jgi:heme oxygenase
MSFTFPPVADPAGGAALARLRASTATRHQAIDGLMDLAQLHDPQRYGRVLRVFEAFLASWEPSVRQALPEHRQGWWQRRSRLPFVRQDLRHLGLAPAAPARLPFALPSAAAAFGSAYVMEGSALGGQFIARQLADSPECSGALAYFRGWGAETGACWREFRAVLDNELQAPTAIAEACTAARDTFDALSDCLREALDERTAPA